MAGILRCALILMVGHPLTPPNPFLCANTARLRTRSTAPNKPEAGPAAKLSSQSSLEMHRSSLRCSGAQENAYRTAAFSRATSSVRPTAATSWDHAKDRRSHGSTTPCTHCPRHTIRSLIVLNTSCHRTPFRRIWAFMLRPRPWLGSRGGTTPILETRGPLALLTVNRLRVILMMLVSLATRVSFIS